MSIQRLDSFINYFYDNRRYQKIAEVHKSMLPNEPILHTLIVLNKMVKDGYITSEEFTVKSFNGKTGELKDTTNPDAYFISYEGILLKEAGGYEAKYERDKIEFEAISTDLTTRKRNDRLLTTGAVGAAIGAFLLIVWEIVKYFFLEHHSF